MRMHSGSFKITHLTLVEQTGKRWAMVTGADNGSGIQPSAKAASEFLLAGGKPSGAARGLLVTYLSAGIEEVRHRDSSASGVACSQPVRAPLIKRRLGTSGWIVYALPVTVVIPNR